MTELVSRVTAVDEKMRQEEGVTTPNTKALESQKQNVSINRYSSMLVEEVKTLYKPVDFACLSQLLLKLRPIFDTAGASSSQ